MLRSPAAALTALSLTLLTLVTAPAAGAAVDGDLAEDCDDDLILLRGTRRVGDDHPVRTGRCDGVRPGGEVLIETPDPTTRSVCTLNFVLTGQHERDGETVERRFIATAGHCVLEGLGEMHWDDGDGPRAWVYTDGTHVANARLLTEELEIGRFAYAVNEGDRDFALIELHAEVEADPQVCHWGGPTAVEDGLRSGPQWLRHTGHGFAWSWAVPGRTGYAPWFDDPDAVFFVGAGSWGDSGSPVTLADTGEAVAILKGARVVPTTPRQTGVIATRLRPQMERASEVLGLDGWRLETAEPLDE